MKLTLTTQIMLGMVGGILLGILFGPAVGGLKLLGDIFLRLIQMTVVLLIFGAVIEALGNLPANALGRLGLKTALWFLGTTIVAAAIGLLMGLWLKPGAGLHLTPNTPNTVKAPAKLGETVLGFFPQNIFASLSQGNVIQVIIFAILFGIVLNQANRHHQFEAVLSLVKQVNQLAVRLVLLVMHLAPIGIGALMIGVTVDTGLKALIPLLKFLAIYGLSTGIFLAILLLVISWYAKVPLKGLVNGFTRIALVAFTTTSSAVSLPIEMADAHDRLGVSQRITQLVLPLGMALNSNGLAMYLALVCTLVTQLYQLQISFAGMVQIVSLSVLACLGTVVVPGGGLVALAIIIPTLGLPTESIALLAGIDWFSGMFRTVANVVGDTTTAIAIASDEHELDRQAYTHSTLSSHFLRRSGTKGD
ncbi:dicarboxylate/amino acid:cation symporter [Levilactobacillus namurensis]|uniref:dicarboxylate/amino acid:cation symporter n=1 Tax=Levilactobacillus namurensis TaxID=380393 RepID=UPI00222FAB17|nr:dicarboxylate/amino acid:cation symporter [Levilactobacillus namurensis]MCW3777501.1 dicarboxylate/amino acid:cation symporter [Levilactobacillus namurensis]MDT7018701.1 dicarboxylate/amino acid:cation symporter [Levilactobacillus namurensis]WNN66674.1 dicarboxylate/amino acid:cation symporter [Levilactobacillus namurensis]